MRSRRAAGKHSRLGGLHGDDADLFVVPPEGASDAMEGVTRAHRMHEGVEMARALLPELLAQRYVPVRRVRIVQLIAKPVVRLTAHFICLGDHGLDEQLVDSTAVAG